MQTLIVTTATRCRLLLAAMLATACTAPALNSDRIAERFGNYSVTVLGQDRDWRVSSLASTHGGRRITRTLALVRYDDPDHAAWAAEDRAIRRGASIGETFRAAGWRIDKPPVFVGHVTAGADLPLLGRLMRIDLPATLAVHAYRFDVGKEDTTLTYATIVELHHPDYLDVAALRRLYRSAPTASNADGKRLMAGLAEVLEALPGEFGGQFTQTDCAAEPRNRFE